MSEEASKSQVVESGRALLRRARAVDAEVLLAELSERQFLKPQRTLIETLSDARRRWNLCPQTVDRAVDWLGLDGAVTIGRLRRTELTQLARCLARFNRHVAASSKCEPG